MKAPFDTKKSMSDYTDDEYKEFAKVLKVSPDYLKYVALWRQVYIDQEFKEK